MWRANPLRDSITYYLFFSATDYHSVTLITPQLIVSQASEILTERDAKAIFLHPLSIMEKTQIAMNNEQWRTVIDAVNDKYPDSDCMDILINSVPYFPTFLINN